MPDVYQLREARDKKIEEKKDRRKMTIIILGIVLIAIAGLAVFSYFYNNRCFYHYDVKSSVERKDTNNIGYLYHNKKLLKYSRSGISAIDNKGKAVWNGGFEMKQPQLDTSGKYVSVADIGGKNLYVYSGEDEGVSVETTLPIVRAKVSENGVVAALVEDSDSNILNIYNPYNKKEKLAVEIPTNVSDEGYPLDFDISPDGKSVVTSQMMVKGNTVETKVSFYNFTEVGQDQNTLVGGKLFGEKVISAIEFLGEDTVCVFYEDGFSIFKNMKKPELVNEVTYKETIKSISFDEEYLVVVTQQNDETQTMHLCQLNGKEISSSPLGFSYANMKIYKNEIFFWSSKECHIVRSNGKEKFSSEFEDVIDGFFPTDTNNSYTIIDREKINVIALKR